jgi:hypothetical protein
MNYSELFEYIYNDTGCKNKKIYHLDPASRVAWKIIEDLGGRRGYRQIWDELDSDIRNEIFKSSSMMISDEFYMVVE